MGECSQCGACCKFLTFTIQGIQSRRMELEYYKAHGCKVVKERVIVPMRCPHLTEDNKCDIHDRKPFLCKQFKGKKSGDRFTIPEECTYG